MKVVILIEMAKIGKIENLSKEMMNLKKMWSYGGTQVMSSRTHIRVTLTTIDCLEVISR
jgi:hypothetical protein